MKKLYRSFLVLVLALCGITSVYADENIAIAAGGGHTLFLKHDGTVWASGPNNSGELGVVTSGPVSTPVKSNINNVVSIAVGSGHSVFLKNDGTVWVSGRNNFGQLGNGTVNNAAIPVQVVGIDNVIAVAALDDMSAFLRVDGTVWATGRIIAYQFGVSTTATFLNVTQMTNAPTGAIAMAIGTQHSVYLKADGTAWGLGVKASSGLVSGSVAWTATPLMLNLNGSVAAIAASRYHSLYLLGDGTVWSAGTNAYGQAGNGSFSETALLGTMTNGGGVQKISASASNSFFIKKDGTAWGVGANDRGQLGDGTYSTRNTPVQLAATSDIIDVAGAMYRSFFMKTDGTVWGSGYRYGGALGNGISDFVNQNYRTVTLKGSSTDTCNDSYLHLLPCGPVVELNAILQKVYQGGVPTTREQVAVTVKVFNKSIKPIPAATQYGTVYLNEFNALVATCQTDQPCSVPVAGDYYIIAKYLNANGIAAYQMKPIKFTSSWIGDASVLFINQYDSSYNLLWTH